MFCPNCTAFINEMVLIKSNARYVPGKNEPVEYDARCPICRVAIGKMSWGQLIVASDLVADTRSKPAEAQSPPPDDSRDAPPEEHRPEAKYCPHCGKELPPDL